MTKTSRELTKTQMYLIDTNVISEIRKGQQANHGVRQFFNLIKAQGMPLFLSVITVGELRRGIELIRHRGDLEQAKRLERWLDHLLTHYEQAVLPIDHDVAQLWGRLRVPHYENPLDKLIAATALIHDLTLVTRNAGDFSKTGVRLNNPFT